MANKLVYIGFGFLHHLGGHAGYHQIKNYLGYDYLIDVQKFHNKVQELEYSTIWGRIRKRIFPYFYLGFPYFPWFLLKCIWMALTKGNLTFHFIYGENLYRNIPLLRLNGCKVVCTLHQPYEWFATCPTWVNRLKSLDHIILVGETEVPLFKKLTGKDNVTFIPHGICSDFYCSDSIVKKEKMILTVGNWLRDFNFANEVYQQLIAIDSEVRVVIVSNPKNKSLITPNERISFISGISDEELLDLYRRTSCLFLPLTRYTANNALLEAAAVGCSILIACNQPDNSYIRKDMINICPMNSNTVVELIEKLLLTKSSIDNLADFVNRQYSWYVVAKLTKDCLYSI